ncbi:hypothetical protein M5K25_017982 [Dendrobium thyrsiflorum]|uniref:Uncharacterized protein n=1 Tax=Dendrobium thyrsiflorum TaxID=117978 RepID=A0ABD0UHH6_DENTH
MTCTPIACWNIRGFNNPDKVRHCKDLVNSYSLKFLCILEAKIQLQSSLDPWLIGLLREKTTWGFSMPD